MTWVVEARLFKSAAPLETCNYTVNINDLKVTPGLHQPDERSDCFVLKNVDVTLKVSNKINNLNLSFIAVA